jgi:hypothetical protein
MLYRDVLDVLCSTSSIPFISTRILNVEDMYKDTQYNTIPIYCTGRQLTSSLSFNSKRKRKNDQLEAILINNRLPNYKQEYIFKSFRLYYLQKYR